MNTSHQPDSSAENGDPETERRIQTYQRRLRRLASELSLAEARERREIASDLHEHIGQALAYVSQKVTTLKGNAVFSGMEDDFAEILSLLGQAIKYTRNLTVEISPPVLYELGLPAAIDWLAERAQERHDFRVRTHHTGERRQVPEDVSVFVFKAVQELIANAAKHAKPDEVSVRTNWSKQVLDVVVEDDGAGFDTSTLDTILLKRNCFGLFSIRERLSYLGGALSIESVPGKGTAIRLTAPYQPSTGDDRD